MDYKKKYKDAINRAKAMVKVANSQEEIYNSVITIFPELKESEDEMIRKEIISYLHNEKNVKRYISDIEFDKWIAWLEKQGKPRMQNGITINGVEYELIEVNEADECERCAFKEQCRRKGGDVICTSVFGLDITAYHRFEKR